MRKLTMTTIVLGILGYAAVGLAFPYHDLFEAAASGSAGTNRAGSEGLYGTGAQSDLGIKCSHCHIDSPGLVRGEVQWRPTGSGAFVKVNADDTYTPGQKYDIQVVMTNEQKKMFNASMPTMRTDTNGMAVIFENTAGSPVGIIESDSGQSYDASNPGSCSQADPFASTKPANTMTTVIFGAYGKCKGVLFLDAAPALVQWNMKWTAPAAGTGDVTIFLGIVDGDKAGDNSLDDDVFERAIPIKEGP